MFIVLPSQLRLTGLQFLTRFGVGNSEHLSRMAGNLNPIQIAEKFAMVKRIISPTNKKPTIVNETSRFVVVTYWWGSGRENFNTARPCGEFYESLLDKPTHLLSPATATSEKFQTALLRNPKFTEFLTKKITDYEGVLRAYKTEGKPLSRFFVSKTTEQLRSIVNDLTIRYVRSVLPLIQTFQKLIVERVDLEDTFKQRLEKGLTAPAQLENIRARLMELKRQKEDILKEIKGRVGPFKSALDRELRYADPITYDEMIRNWETSCAKAGCNYLAVEYPAFTEPGGYQLAINAKPRFIQKALELCRGLGGSLDRGVLYIDGDMTVNRYPAIFDMPDVDMMARGWNVDPRSSYMHNESILVDPYTFETSGGTMFFGQTPEAHLLLNRWIEVSEKCYQWGKADDRILSLVFNTYKLLLPLKIVQLPIEYLWLTLDYDSMDPEAIFLEHPECLTSEETAEGQGASSSRTPKFYATIEDSYPRSEYLHEAVMFPTAESTSVFRPYLNYLSRATYFEDVEDPSLIDGHPFQVVPFAEGLKPFQDIVNMNQSKVAKLSRNLSGSVYTDSTNSNNKSIISNVLSELNQTMKYGNNSSSRNSRNNTFVSKTPTNINEPAPYNTTPTQSSIVLTENNEMTIPTILYWLTRGIHVNYIPKTANPQYIDSLKYTLEKFPRLEFAFVNLAKDMRRIFYFQSTLNVKEPAFFGAGSPQLLQLLSTCETLSDLAERFRNGYQFLSRIRTTFLKRYRRLSQGDSEVCRVLGYSKEQRGGNSYSNISSEDIAEDAEDGLYFLYGDMKNLVLQGGISKAKANTRARTRAKIRAKTRAKTRARHTYRQRKLVAGK